MGAKDSKRACIDFENASKRINETELRRIRAAFNRLSNGSNTITKDIFIQDVLSECVPPTVINWLYTACGGVAKGITLNDLICGLVLLTRGTQDEHIKFLWNFYSNDANTYILKSDFYRRLKSEYSYHIPHVYLLSCPEDKSHTLFIPQNNDRATFDQFRLWLKVNNDGTVLSQWLLVDLGFDISCDLEMPTFYQTLAGVTHLEEQEICELEKCFFNLQSSSPTEQLDLACICPLISPPIPQSACLGLFLALDENRDGHIDFKELCCGVSAACRGPLVERIKFCFKVFDLDADGKLNPNELKHMAQVLALITNEQNTKKGDQYESVAATESLIVDNILQSLNDRLIDGALNLEEFLIWGVQDSCPALNFVQLLFEICHVALGLKPQCKHNEYDIVTKWLAREERRGYQIGQFWYLISEEWWQKWLNYTTSTSYYRNSCSLYHMQHNINHQSQMNQVEEGIVCDESFTSNSTGSDSMGEFLVRNNGDTASIASSSGVSSGSSGCLSKNNNGNGSTNHILQFTSTPPGPIDNSNLISQSKNSISNDIPSLTGEGGRLRKDITLVQHRDFELVPDSLWKALSLWYGGPLPLPRQVIRSNNISNEIDLELYPLNLRILRHQNISQNESIDSQVLTPGMQQFWNSSNEYNNIPRRYLANMAAFSRLATVRQVAEFLAQHSSLSVEDVRLWHIPTVTTNASHLSVQSLSNDLILLDDDQATLQELNICDDDQILLEVRNKDLTWPEELGALCNNSTSKTNNSGHRCSIVALPPGATGLHNLGNTCFMNAALQAVSNTRPLLQYFVRDLQMNELNFSNPLGTQGQLAQRYGELCRELWTGHTRSVAPLKIRWCVSKHAPHLSGGGQHDSQELLAWLLDGLHEDLNRVTSSKYTELKDSDGRADAVVAKEAWDQHLARNKSIVIDLFYGQLKSKVTCQTCGHESVRFDPFNMLSLPLPMESFTLCEITVIRLDASIPIKYGIRLNSESTYTTLKSSLSKLCEIDISRLLLVECINSQLKLFPNDLNKLKNSNYLELLAYELPLSEFEKQHQKRRESVMSNIVNRNSIINQPIKNNLIIDKDQINNIKTNSGASSIDEMSTNNTNDAVEPLNNSTLEVNLNNITLNVDTNGATTAESLNYSRRLSTIPSNTRSNSLQMNELYTNSYYTSYNQNNIYNNYQNNNNLNKSFIIAVHRKMVRQDTYFLSQHKCKPIVFGTPILLEYDIETTTCQDLYESVWQRVARLLTTSPQTDQTNHATDCDDSLSYKFPFSLCMVNSLDYDCKWCGICQWNKFCRGCRLYCKPITILDAFSINQLPNNVCLAIDWDQTALHLRYQHSKEKACLEHETIEYSRRKHIEPIDLDHCLRAFTSEEKLEEKYHCSSCKSLQPATKKLQIWRLPPILIIHLKRFDFVNGKWAKTQKVVNFPFNEFDPTDYLASVPQATIHCYREFYLRRQLPNKHHHPDFRENDEVTNNVINENEIMLDTAYNKSYDDNIENKTETAVVQFENSSIEKKIDKEKRLSVHSVTGRRERLESTSLQRTPVNVKDLQDFHQHHLKPGQDPFDLKYSLYSVVCHSGMLNGGHYICYANNPNGSWYCYNDSSCREVGRSKLNSSEQILNKPKIPTMDTSNAYMLFYERKGLDYVPYLRCENDKVGLNIDGFGDRYLSGTSDLGGSSDSHSMHSYNANLIDSNGPDFDSDIRNKNCVIS